MLHAPAMEQRTEAAARGRARAAAVNARDVATEPLVVGNQASLRRLGAPQLVRPSRMPMLQRTCAGGGACADCNDEKDAFQAKLAVNEPGDEYEQQADRVADQVMRMPEPPEGAHRKVEAASLQRHASDTAISEDVQLIVAEALRSPGQPLDAETRAFIEPRFGVDFGAVLVHSNAKAAASARALDAVAYTVGRDLVFADGCYAPCTSGGRRLLAHELTHTIQQGGVVGPTDHAVAQRQDYRSDSTAPVDEESLPASSKYSPVSACQTVAAPPAIQPKLEVDAVDDPLEHEADRVANEVMRMPEPDVSVNVSTGAGFSKVRACEEDKQKLQRKTNKEHNWDELKKVMDKFSQKNDHLSPEQLKKIKESVFKTTWHSATFEVAYAFFDYYSGWFGSKILLMTPAEETNARKLDRLAETKPRGDTKLRPDALDLTDERLGAVLLHEFGHTGQSESVMAMSDYQEGAAYGIEYFYAERNKDFGSNEKYIARD